MGFRSVPYRLGRKSYIRPPGWRVGWLFTHGAKLSWSRGCRDPRQGRGSVQRNQTVFEMVEEVLDRQARSLVVQTGQTFEAAIGTVAGTEAGRQLRELRDGPHRDEKAAEWQASLPWRRVEERHYSWVEGYMEWLKGKEERAGYHALLEEELASLRG
jgi:hypothetical protein